MPVSDKKKASNAKWDNVNMTTLGCRMRKEQATAFKSYCAKRGATSNTVLKDYVLECIGETGGDVPEARQRARGAPQSAGVVSLPSNALECAQGAAEATGEGVTEFVCRAVKSQAKRDNASLRMGINPATGEKLEKQNNGTEAKP